MRSLIGTDQKFPGIADSQFSPNNDAVCFEFRQGRWWDLVVYSNQYSTITLPFLVWWSIISVDCAIVKGEVFRWWDWWVYKPCFCSQNYVWFETVEKYIQIGFLFLMEQKFIITVLRGLFVFEESLNVRIFMCFWIFHCGVRDRWSHVIMQHLMHLDLLLQQGKKRNFQTQGLVGRHWS